jgi:stage II sporulation protein D
VGDWPIGISSPLRATDADADAAVGVFEAQYGGWGHGVGMSQDGAEGYALHGAEYRDILAHCFQGRRGRPETDRPGAADRLGTADVHRCVVR